MPLSLASCSVGLARCLEIVEEKAGGGGGSDAFLIMWLNVPSAINYLEAQRRWPVYVKASLEMALLIGTEGTRN